MSHWLVTGKLKIIVYYIIIEPTVRISKDVWSGSSAAYQKNLKKQPEVFRRRESLPWQNNDCGIKKSLPEPTTRVSM